MSTLMDIQQQKLSKILLIGDSCHDVYCFGKCERISPEAPVPVLRIVKEEIRPGMVLNVRKNLSNFFEGTIDTYTNKEKIIKKRYVEENTKQHMLRVDIGEEKKLTPMTIQEASEINYQDYLCVVISDYDKGYITHQVANYISEKTLAAGQPLFVDTKKTNLSCYNGAIIKINEHEFKKIKRFQDFGGDLIVTLGSRGALHKGKNLTYPTEKVEVFDVCGAGDTFFAGLVYSYLLDKNISESIKFANRCASISVKKFGTYAIQKGDVA